MLFLLSIHKAVAALPDTVIAIAAVLAAMGAIYFTARKVFRWAREAMRKYNEMYDSLAGFDPLVDPVSGNEVRPAVPRLTNRVSVIEHWQAEIVPLLDRITQVLERMTVLEERVLKLEKKIERGSTP